MKRRDRKQRPLLIGLTGGIASGKTTVACHFESLGARVIEADRISREIVQPGKPAWKAVVKAFGKEILAADRTIDRARLAVVVFGEPRKRKLLERITHPAIIAETNRRVAALAKGRIMPEAIVLDVPLLFEAGLDKTVDATVVVWVPKSVQVERLRRRDGLSAGDIRRRFAAQMPLSEKRRRADFVVNNARRPGEVRAQVKKIWGVLTIRGK